MYESVIEEFDKHNCKLLTTKEEYNKILIISKSQNYRLRYTASCGHEHTVFYNVFKSRGTGIICPSCKNKKNGQLLKDKIKDNKITNIEQEFNFIMKIREYLIEHFDFVKAFDGCKVDIIYKPKTINEDKWVGIQVKTTTKRRSTYSFHIQNSYIDCLLLLYSIDDESIWIIPENIIRKQSKLSIGYNKSKYNIYKVPKDNIINKLNELYKITTHFSFDKLNLPINYYQQREQEFRKYRENKLPFIKFEYDQMEGTVYDFKIGILKIQEKVSIINSDNYCNFCIYRGRSNNFMRYNIGDNDLYWLNCDDKISFFVIPEHILIEKGIVGNETTLKMRLKIQIKTPLDKKSEWLSPYMFDYNNIDKDRLLNLLTK